MQIRHILKLRSNSITGTVTESFTAIDSKDLKLIQKQTRHSLKLKTDSAINSLTVILNDSERVNGRVCFLL